MWACNCMWANHDWTGHCTQLGMAHMWACEMEINHISLKCLLRRDTMGSLQPKGNFMLLSMAIVHHPVLFFPSPSYCKNCYEKITPSTPCFSWLNTGSKLHCQIFLKMINYPSTNIICNGISHLTIACK